ncbi:MAG: protein-tyrosine phosphatase [Acidimicrobiaceae bacterium]|nr:protein-tyrosine phosphatase [Acidimicrobiaceae bacterium]
MGWVTDPIPAGAPGAAGTPGAAGAAGAAGDEVAGAILDVEVDRRSPSQIVLRWRVAGTSTPLGPIAIEISTTGPDGAATQRHEVTGGNAETVLNDVSEHPRPWFRISTGAGPHLLVAERRLPVPGTLNFRDLGGYPTAAGRTVWGRVFRSDNFAEVPPEGWRQLHDMGLREVFDLRHDSERERQPTAVPDDLDIAISVLAIGGEAAESPDVIEMLTADDGRSFGVDFMVTMYEELVAGHGQVFATLLSHLSDAERLPAVFHCTAGKDRTGVAAALLLRLLGVDRETVLDDYELTTRYRSTTRIEQLRPRLEAAGVDVEAVRPFLSAPRPALAAALDAIDARHGSVEGFLLAHGLDAAVPDRLRASLVAAA